jgi:hypothetical protein
MNAALRHARQALTVILAIVAGLALLACQSKPQVRADYDRSTDFSKYRTFNFVSQPSTDKQGYSSLLTEQLKAAVTTEMQKRGYTLSESPDLLVNFSGKLQNMQEVRSSPSPTPAPYYGYRTGMYGAWPGYANDVYTVNYTEGTLNIDLIDASHKAMVWEGVGVGEVTKEKMQDRQASLNRAVAHIFAKFPFRAGESKAVTTASE